MRFLFLGLMILSLSMGCKPDVTDITKSTKEEKQEPPKIKPPSPQPSVSSENKLLSYIATMSPAKVIDPAVLKLALIGNSRYKDPATGLKEIRDGYPFAGGRKSTWIKDTFVKEESEIIEELKKLDPPKTFTVEEIDKVYQEMVSKNPPDANIKKAPFILVKGVNISYLHESPLAKNSFTQLASQFNYLESKGAYITSVSEYIDDPTQGPLGSIEAAAAALHRMAAMEAKKLPNALADLLPSRHDHYYKDGYLELAKLRPDDKDILLDHFKANIKQLAILPQWVLNEASGTAMIHVLSAAPQLNTPSMPCAICSLLVAAQYEAIAKLAVIRSLAIMGPVNVHLTLVGQGAFFNPEEVMADAFKIVAEVVRGYPNVHIYVHGFSDPDQAIIREQAAKIPIIDLTEMEKNDFMKAQ